MAVITVSSTDSGQFTERWDIPPGDVLPMTNVPRGIFTFDGTASYAAKLAADNTRVIITLDFNDNYCFLLKNVSFMVTSDDQSLDFDDTGQFNFGQTSAVDSFGNLHSPGVIHFGSALASRRIYSPAAGFPRVFLDGELEDCQIGVADVSTDASSAGDVFWHVEFFVFDKDQCLNYPTNTPQAVISFG